MSVSISHFFARAVWLKVHLYLALTLGLLFCLLGLTGSMSLYRDQIDELLNPNLVIAQPQARMLSADKILAAVRSAHPDRFGVWTLEMPRTANSALVVWYEKPRETVGEFYAPLMVAVNPYTGEVLASRFWGQTLTTWLVDLHTHLQLGGSGRNAVALLAVFFAVSIISGLCLWWPGWRQLATALNIRHDAGLLRFLLDMHRLLGLGSAGFLLVLVFTGFHLAYPPLLETITASSGMGHDGGEGPNVHSSAVPNDRPVSLTEAVLVARGLFPSSDVRRITTPWGDTGTYRINLRQHHEINQHHPLTMIWIDRWSGQIRDVRNPVKFSSGQTFTAWMWPLHSGEALGGFKFIWFLAGLTPSVLYITGLWHWLGRRGVVADRQLDVAAQRRRAMVILRQIYRLMLQLAEITKNGLAVAIAYIRHRLK